MIGEFVWVPISKVIEPQGNTVTVHRDNWWLVNDSGEVAFYRPGPKSPDLFPQCNSNKNLADGLRKQYGPEFTGVVFLPISFSPYRP